jgi:hypothetical protein
LPGVRRKFFSMEPKTPQKKADMAKYMQVMTK